MPDVTDAAEVLTLREAATLLKLGTSTTYQLAKRGQLPAAKVGGSWRLVKSELLAFLTQDSRRRYAKRGLQTLAALLLSVSIPTCGPAPAFAEVNDVQVAFQTAQEYDLTPFQTKALLCIRLCENGRAGREYGVLHPKALGRSQQVQCQWAAGSIQKRLRSPEDLPGFASRWAPAGASNDPRGMNAHWLNNVQTCLRRLE